MKDLIIIHGWAYSIEPWNETVRLLRARGIKIEQLRVPGLTEPSSKVWTIDDYVEWLHGKLKGRTNIAVLGHSNGGRISMHYLQRYPNGFSQLILLNAAGLYYRSEALSLKRRIIRIAAKLGKPLAKIPLLHKIFYRLIGSDYGRAPANMKKTLSNMLESDKMFDPASVSCESIDLLWGCEDRVTPIGMGRQLHSKLAGSRLKEFDGWQHAPYRTHPRQLADAIEEVLS